MLSIPVQGIKEQKSSGFQTVLNHSPRKQDFFFHGILPVQYFFYFALGFAHEVSAGKISEVFCGAFYCVFSLLPVKCVQSDIGNTHHYITCYWIKTQNVSQILILINISLSCVDCVKYFHHFLKQLWIWKTCEPGIFNNFNKLPKV